MNLVLPVELTAFSGEAMSKYNALNWETVTEQNAAEFAIERSIDGRNSWEKIGTVTAAGNSQETRSYAFNDLNPQTENYYRLNTIDIDGASQLSDVIAVKRTITGFEELTITPNPAKAQTILTFQAAQTGSLEITITDKTGKLLMTKKVEIIDGTNRLPLDLTTLPSGIYVVTLNNGSETISERIVKK